MTDRYRPERSRPGRGHEQSIAERPRRPQAMPPGPFNKRNGSHSPPDRPSKVLKQNHQGSLITPRSPSADSRRSSVTSARAAPPSRREDGVHDRASQQLQLEMDEMTRRLAVRSADASEKPLTNATTVPDGTFMSPNSLQNDPSLQGDDQNSDPLEALLIKFSYCTATLSTDMLRSQQATEYLQQAENEYGACQHQFEQFPVVRERKSRARADARRTLDARNETLAEHKTNMKSLAKHLSVLIGSRSRADAKNSRTDYISRDEYDALQTKYDAALKRKADEDAIEKRLTEIKGSHSKVVMDVKATEINIKKVQEDNARLGKSYSEVMSLQNDMSKRSAETYSELVKDVTAVSSELDSIDIRLGRLDATISDTASTVSSRFNTMLGEQASISKRVHDVSNIREQVTSIQGNIDLLRQDLNKLEKASNSMPHKSTESIESNAVHEKALADTVVGDASRKQVSDDARVEGLRQELNIHASHITRLFERADHAESETQRLVNVQADRDDAIIAHMTETFAAVTALTELDTRVTGGLESCITSVPIQVKEAISLTEAATKAEADEARLSHRKELDSALVTLQQTAQRITTIESELTTLARSVASKETSGSEMTNGNQIATKQNAAPPELYDRLQKLQQELEKFVASITPEVGGVKMMISGLQRRFDDLTTEHVVQAMANRMSTMYPDVRNCQAMITKLQAQLNVNGTALERCAELEAETKRKLTLHHQDCHARSLAHNGMERKHEALITAVTERVAAGETGLKQGDGRLHQVERDTHSLVEKMKLVKQHSIEVNTRLKLLESEMEGS